MTQFYKTLPIASEQGFVYFSDIFCKYNISIYAVGGCVRDSLLLEQFDEFVKDNYVTDIDLAVPVPPLKTIDILERETIKYFTTGIDFGTVTAHYNGKNYEITSFRQDIITDGRHAVVAYTDQMILDAQRRDFTVNALYYDNKGIVYDPLKQGISDLHHKKINFIGNADARIHEDYLRILRYFRFLARFGMDNYQADIFLQYDYTRGLKKLSEHRIACELKKMILYPFASDALLALIALNYHVILFPELQLNVILFQKFKTINLYSDYLLASLLFYSDTKALKKILLLSKQDKKRISEFSQLYHHMHDALEKQNWIKILDLQYDYDVNLWRNMLDLIVMDVRYSHLNDKIEVIKHIIMPPFLLTGHDLIAQGYKQGKQISVILRQKRLDFVSQFLQKI